MPLDLATTGELVTTTWTMLAPLIPVIARKAAETTGEESVKRLWAFVSGRMRQDAAAERAVEKLLKTPENADRAATFRTALEDLIEDDASFAAELKALLTEIGSTTTLENRSINIQGNASNNIMVSGKAGNISQTNK